MKIPMTSKLPDVGTTIFAVMSQLALDCKAINLSQGFPSFEPPAELIDRIDHYLRSGANQYAPMPGVPTLRRAIARYAPAQPKACSVRYRLSYGQAMK
jgi:methionine aminotransferase